MKNFCKYIALLLIVSSCNNSKPLLYHKNVKSQSICEEKNGYWYKGKCWIGFEEVGIGKDDIDKVVAEHMLLIQNARVKVNSKSHPIIFFFPEMEDQEVLFITMYEDEKGTKTILQSVNERQLESDSFSAFAFLFDGNLLALSEDKVAKKEMLSDTIAKGMLKLTVHDLDNLEISFAGLLRNEKTEKNFQIEYKSSDVILEAGTSTLEIKDNEIHINGTLGIRTYIQLKNAIKDHPKAKTVVLGKINGSVSDDVNMHTGRILREAGLATKVLKNSNIASGGVDLFCAGKERIVEKGAKIGIHSWCCFNNLTAAELPKDHPAHQYQVEYFTMCLGEEVGPDFYFYTLSAAPFNGIYWMNDEEIKKWTVATEFHE